MHRKSCLRYCNLDPILHAFFSDNSKTHTANVRRYVALAQSRGGACFCTRGAMQGYDVICLLSRWQKP